MVMFETMKASEAPEPPRKRSQFASELIAAVAGLGDDEVLRLTPEPDKSIRGIKTGIGRVAAKEGMKLTSYDDGEFVYVKKV